MKVQKVFKFDEVMDIYDELCINKKPVRFDPVLKSVTPRTISERIIESIRLSEELIWKKQLKK